MEGESKKRSSIEANQPMETLHYYSSGSLASQSVISLATAEDWQIPEPGSANHHLLCFFLLLLANTIAKPAVIEKWSNNNINVLTHF